MRLSTAFAAVAAFAASLLPAAAQAPTKVQVGVLRCNVAPYVGFVLGSVREMTCELRTGMPGATKVAGLYKGSVARFGIDIGAGGPSVLGWAVFAPTNAPTPVDLAGKYVGVSADAAWGLGAGANVLLGGSNSTIALQPLSLEGTTGIAIAAGVSDLTLTPAR
ncbi:DUF992 domain-containing protein [Aquabacter spiritensis]|uniref:Uncharacterized protein DUF992 n=1 Tax=Aquabacter spiritensis TaxID=933073 RepID=A0A4R3LWY2_9HYPH|nr:DUF992 domain-containing protein [Aquabacter spiritensis]TCT03185.1 uncharacterized protein DUF992 [Aquabacter spiritensis]